ncbi:MAG: CehA/McbA family metallohydrolase [Clostridiales bacterium]|nr:CehA/McbA family metallohydrolase [Clostridiales bacterium]
MRLFEPGKRFYKGNLHMHTTASDGKLSFEEAARRYQEAGYDFICITDHRIRSVDTQTLGKMLVLPGTEIDFFLGNQVIHIVGVNIKESFLSRYDVRWGPQRGINEIRAAGGLAILAHPLWSLNTTETINSLLDLTAVEIYNSTSAPPWNGDRADATGLLDIACAAGVLHNTVAVDDAHHYNGDECLSFIMLQADELSPSSIMQALSDGAFYASQGPQFTQVHFEGDTVRVECSPVARILFHSNRPYAPDRCWQGEGITQASYTIRRDWNERFVRVIIQDEEGRRAWANPIEIPY